MVRWGTGVAGEERWPYANEAISVNIAAQSAASDGAKLELQPTLVTCWSVPLRLGETDTRCHPCLHPRASGKWHLLAEALLSMKQGIRSHMDQVDKDQKKGNQSGSQVDITALRIAIRQLRRNLGKLKNKTGAKAQSARERTERKIAAKMKLLEATGLPLATKRTKRRKSLDYGFKGYDGYISSPQWAAKRQDYFSRHSCECRSCGASDGVLIHLHHITYERLFNEPDNDLMPLCNKCHAALHLVHRSFKMNVTEATDIWFSVTNKTPQKKKIRAMLRDISLDTFKHRWSKRKKSIVSPALALIACIECLIQERLGPRDEATDELVLAAVRAKGTGFTREYDEQVDALIQKLERA